MLLAIDAGNTNIVFAVYEKDTQKCAWRCKTDSGRTSDEYASFLHQLFMQSGLEFSDITAVIISSVVPEAKFHLNSLCHSTFNLDPLWVGPDDVAVNIKIDRPEDIGSDRIVNAIAVKTHYQLPCVIVDFGTATTFDVIDKGGAYCGGVIAPGPNMSVNALNREAARLPKVSIKRPEKVIGTDTVGAIQSGIYWGYISMIEGMIGRISKDMNEKPYVIATGGLASLFSDGTNSIDIVDDDLTLKGLLEIYKSKN